MSTRASNEFFLGLVVGAAVVGISFGTSILVLKASSAIKGSSKSFHIKDVMARMQAQPAESADPEAERAPERDAFWFEEPVSPFFSTRVSVNKIMFDTVSKFQKVQIMESQQFGKTLVMDGQTQSAQADEKIYHESLVHPAMLLHPNPKKVFIGGGGEFATAREVLRHKSVEKCVMVDIDQVACDFCREYLPEWNDGAYDDKRFSVFYEDAKAWLEKSDEKFDVVILDICDPIEAGPGYKLYTQEFYEFLKAKLNPNGIIVTQSGPGSVTSLDCMSVIYNTLRSVYSCVLPYVVDIPSFGSGWGFTLVLTSEISSSKVISENIRNFIMGRNDIDELIEKKINGSLTFLDSTSFAGLFGSPLSIRECLQDEERVMTIDNPVFMYSG